MLLYVVVGVVFGVGKEWVWMWIECDGDGDGWNWFFGVC